MCHMTVTCLECVLEAPLEGVRLGKVYGKTGAELGVDVHHLGGYVTQWKVTDHVILLKVGGASQYTMIKALCLQLFQDKD